MILTAFDIETSGPYPLESQIIEIGALKWSNGQVIDKFQTFIHSDKPLTAENIKIHGITDEMLKDAPKMNEQIEKFVHFIDGTILLAHHAPFDVGFMAPEIEKNKISFPKNTILCTSLLSRALIHTTNHKLQTLVKELNLTGGSAHRAYDDAFACLQVFLKCVEKLSPDYSLEDLLKIQKKDLHWNNYRIYSDNNPTIAKLVQAIEANKCIDIVYEGGRTKSRPRSIRPMGLVRNPDGDYVKAECQIDKTMKRFYLNKILDI